MEYSTHMTNPVYMHMHCDGTCMFIYIHVPNMVPHVGNYLVIYMYPIPFIQNNQQGHVIN